MIGALIGYSKEKNIFQLGFYTTDSSKDDMYRIGKIKQSTKKCASYIPIQKIEWDPEAKEAYSFAVGVGKNDEKERQKIVFLLGDLIEKFGYTMEDIQLLVSMQIVTSVASDQSEQ